MNADMKWLDNPEVFRVNQLDAHSDHCYYMDYADMEKSEKSLNMAFERVIYIYTTNPSFSNRWVV